jgi:thiamine kinase-like enzyme
MTYNFVRSLWRKASPIKLIESAYNLIPAKVDPHTVAAAERVLSTAVGSPVQFTHIECLSKRVRRNVLLQCHNPSEVGLPPSLIIKKVKVNPHRLGDTDSWHTVRFFHDWVGAQFLSTLPGHFKHSPRFYGGDRNLGLIILEDVQHSARLVESLLGNDDAQAEQALLQYASCLGQLHTHTIDRAAAFEELFKAIAPNVKPIKDTVNIHKHQLMLASLGIYTENSWLHDLEAINEAINHPGEFLAYIHADACPDNVLDTGETLRLIDFETGHFGHALIDAAYGRMMFPSCWCANRLPHAVVRQMENTYRAILMQRCPVAADDQIFEIALVKTCGFWLLYTLTRHLEYALRKDLHWGISTIRQRILARLEAFTATAQEFNQLPGLCNTSSQLLDLLRQRWANVPALPLYPAFQKTEVVVEAIQRN